MVPLLRLKNLNVVSDDNSGTLESCPQSIRSALRRPDKPWRQPYKVLDTVEAQTNPGDAAIAAVGSP